MTDISTIDANFEYNAMLAKALVQLMPGEDRAPIEQWLEKLIDLDKDDTEKEKRNEYMWFILLMLQTQRIRAPFNMYPPVILKPLRELVESTVYEDVLVANEENMKWVDQNGMEHDLEGVKKAETHSSAPSKFLESQPVPNEGVLCYMATFSDHQPRR